jgi:hypothetical protein
LNLSVNGEVDIRITVDYLLIFSYAELSRDQIYLPKEEADVTEVLLGDKSLRVIVSILVLVLTIGSDPS